MSSTNHTHRRRIAARLAVGAVTVAGALALNTDAAAAAEGKECELVAQPYMGAYNLAVENSAGETTSLIDVEQHHRHETPATVLRVSLGDTRVVLWAQTQFPATGHDSWGKVLKVHPTECRWADRVVYDAITIDGVKMRDSVIIRDVAAPATTSTSSLTPTTAIAFTPTTGPVPQRTEATDPAPTSTTSTAPSATSTMVQEQGAPDPTPPGPGAPTLPNTGRGLGAFALGAALAGAGYAMAVAARRMDGVRW